MNCIRESENMQHSLCHSLKASKLLENHCGIYDYDIREHMLKVYEPAFNVGAFNQLLVENQLLVTGINSCEENLEDYFSELIGGGGIA